jgi:hypothetical protein
MRCKAPAPRRRRADSEAAQRVVLTVVSSTREARRPPMQSRDRADHAGSFAVPLLDHTLAFATLVLCATPTAHSPPD